MHHWKRSLRFWLFGEVDSAAIAISFAEQCCCCGRIFSAGFICFHFISLTFSLTDHPGPLLRQMSGCTLPERAIRIRIINIISFHCATLISLQPTAHTRTGIREYSSECIQSAVNLTPPIPTHTHTNAPSKAAKLQFERRQGRGSGGCGGGGGCRARGTPYNGVCGWPAFRWNWIGNLPWLVSITKGLVALDKGCFSNAQNQSLYGLGTLFPAAIQVFLQWSLIKSVKTKLRVISAPPQLLLQSPERKKRPDNQQQQTADRKCVKGSGRIHFKPPALYVRLRLCWS